MLTVKTYSPKGLVVKGASAEQAQAIVDALGGNVCTTHNAKLAGYVFSRKRETRIREIVAGLNAHPADDMPGEWMDHALSGRGAVVNPHASPGTRRVARSRKAPPPLCDCPAPVARYGKAFPHRAGKVRGCHMGPDGYAITPHDGCLCRACELARDMREDLSDSARASDAMRCEEWGALHLQRTPAEWRRLQDEHEQAAAGVLTSTLDSHGRPIPEHATGAR